MLTNHFRSELFDDSEYPAAVTRSHTMSLGWAQRGYTQQLQIGPTPCHWDGFRWAIPSSCNKVPHHGSIWFSDLLWQICTGQVHIDIELFLCGWRVMPLIEKCGFQALTLVSLDQLKTIICCTRLSFYFSISWRQEYLCPMNIFFF